MHNTKKEAIKIIESLPEDCTYEDIQYHLFVREKVERGIEAIEHVKHSLKKKRNLELKNGKVIWEE